MNQQAAQREYERAGELRRGAFELLDEHMRGCELDESVIVELQDAANHLGAVERHLRERFSAQPLGPSVGSPATLVAETGVASRAPERPKTR